MKKEFEVHLLNEDGIKSAGEIAEGFSKLLTELEGLIGQGGDPRCLSIVRTKLEEACFFAKKAMASNSTKQR